ncbi:hypothetical protein ACIO3O_25115 [Streptomyces sp. NPDC087440]
MRRSVHPAPLADAALIDAATALARTAVDLCTDPEQRARVRDAHRRRRRW